MYEYRKHHVCLDVGFFVLRQAKCERCVCVRKIIYMCDSMYQCVNVHVYVCQCIWLCEYTWLCEYISFCVCDCACLCVCEYVSSCSWVQCVLSWPCEAHLFWVLQMPSVLDTTMARFKGEFVLKTEKGITANCESQRGAQGSHRPKVLAAGICGPLPCALPLPWPSRTPHLCCFLVGYLWLGILAVCLS